MTKAAEAGQLVDARGLVCPAPIVRLARVARAAAAGTLVTVLATDPAAEVDVPAWARMRGHTVLRTERTNDGVLAVTVRIGGA